jgi:hypothetical protein
MVFLNRGRFDAKASSMKKLALLASFLAMPLIACGPTPCQQLKTDCDACTNTVAKGACNLIVAALERIKP